MPSGYSAEDGLRTYESRFRPADELLDRLRERLATEKRPEERQRIQRELRRYGVDHAY